MFKAFADGSGSTEPHAYALAGYIARAGRWAEFSDRWQQVLDMSPRQEYFKMSEMSQLSEESYKIKMGLFYEVIEEFVEAQFSVLLNPDDLARLYWDQGSLRTKSVLLRGRLPHRDLG